MMERKLIIFDLDDTLLMDKGVLGDYTLVVLKKVQSKGHLLIFNTARSKFYSKEYFEKIKPDYSILNGGSQILDNKGNTIFKNAIDALTTKAIIDEILDKSISISLQTDNQLYTSSLTYKGQNALYFDFKNDYIKEDCFKLLVKCDDPALIKNIALKYNLAYTNYLNSNIYRLNPQGVTKYYGVERLLEIINEPHNSTIAFGDDLGDMEMILNCHEGIIMCNARDELKNQVKVVSEFSNNEEGVAKYLEERFLRD